MNRNTFEILVAESLRDVFGVKHPVLSNAAHIRAGIDWLCRAQDVAGDGGVSAWFSLIHGWQPSYIETTGYIINTFLDFGEYFHRPDLKKRAIKMADFLLEMQHPLGGYRTAVPSVVSESVPTVFNTGQDLLGLTDVYELTGDQKYLDSVCQAADFLLSIQESDGSWLQYTYGAMKHTYHTRVAWGILKVWKLTGEKKYLEAATRNLDWAAKQQLTNGWFQQNHLPKPNPEVPYTHTIAYAIEGFLWSGLLLKNRKYIQVAAAAALPLAQYFLEHAFLPGTFDSSWESKDHYSCLTGDAQLALVWLTLFDETKNSEFFNAGTEMMKFLKTMQATEFDADWRIRGAIKGSSPIFGDIVRKTGYCRLAYLNWSTKFFIDALLADEKCKVRV